MSFNEEAGTKNPGEIGKLASEKWKALSDNDKEPFIVSIFILYKIYYLYTIIYKIYFRKKQKQQKLPMTLK